MSGSLWWRVRILVDAVGSAADDHRWLSMWFKGSPPDVGLDAGLDNPSFVKPSKIEKALDATLTSDEGDKESTVLEVFAKSEFAPRFPAWDARLCPIENRIKMVHLVAHTLAQLVQAADLRFKVLNMWSAPRELSLVKDGRDTTKSVLEALVGADSAVFSRTSAAPSSTPLRRHGKAQCRSVCHKQGHQGGETTRAGPP